MTSISRQLELPYSAAQMYALVNDVARYPEFVPWCKKAVIHQQDAQAMRASLMIEWKGIENTVTTQNKLIENQSISMSLVQGMVKKLTGKWQFMPECDHACVVKLSVNVEFSNRFAALLFSKVIEQVLNRIMEAFCARAKFLYSV